jgi:hypothetical protein
MLLSLFIPPKRKKMTPAAWPSHKNSRPTSSALTWHFMLNVILTHNLGKESKWTWRVPIIAMQIYPIILFAVIAQLPETPRWHILHEQDDNAKKSIATVFGEDEVENRFKELTAAYDKEMEEGASWGHAMALWQPIPSLQ